MKGRKPTATSTATTGTAAPIPPPDFLGDRERELWEGLAATPAGGTLSPADGPLFAAFVRAIALEERLTREVAALPSCVSESAHGAKVHPAITEARQQRALIRQLAAELGMSPCSRRAVSAPPQPPKPDPKRERLEALRAAARGEA